MLLLWDQQPCATNAGTCTTRNAVSVCVCHGTIDTVKIRFGFHSAWYRAMRFRTMHASSKIVILGCLGAFQFFLAGAWFLVLLLVLMV
eukprot:m.441394 g.441394  ORF g.441394 m.441394 type:complete len:88 (-) comp20282_c2_seq9:176-439(-)